VVPNFQVQLELLARPELRSKPLVVGGGPDQKKVVLDCSPQAAVYGISPGMQLRQALARCHTAVFLEAQPTLYEDVNVRTYRALYALSPRIEVSRQGCFYVDLTGLSIPRPSQWERLGEGSSSRERSMPPRRRRHPHLASPASGRGIIRGTSDSADGEALLLEQLTAAVERASGIRPCAAVATGKFAAYAAALAPESSLPHSSGGRGSRVVPSDQVAAFVAGLSTDYLPVAETIKRRLRLLGLKQLADVARLPKSALQAEFGPAGWTIWDLSHGLDGDRLQALLPAAQLVERIRFDEPLITTDGLLMGAQVLLSRLSERLAAESRSCRGLRLRAELTSKRIWQKQVNLREPTADTKRMLAALKPVFERQVWRAAVEELELLLWDVVPAGGSQPDLFAERNGARQRIASALRHLRARYRPLPIYRVVQPEPDTRIAERRFALASYEAEAGLAELKPLGQPRPISVRGGEYPEAVLWREQWRPVLKVREEWRLNDEWWTHEIARRYFRIVLANGRQLTVFNDTSGWFRA
jgi:nucleotidyltransferase/DNA polymerase involved in DNA repair